MARVLFLTELVPYPLASGAKIRAYYVLRHLSQHHELTLVSFVRADDQPEHLDHLRRFVERVYAVPMQRSLPRNLRAGLTSVFTGRPAIIVREEVQAMRRRVSELLASSHFNVVHADQIPMAQYGLVERKADARRLLDQHNATFEIIDRMAQREPTLWKRAFMRHEAKAFARYEASVCRQFDRVTFVTDNDRQALLAQVQQRYGIDAGDALAVRTQVIPICVDTAEVQPATPVPAPFRVLHVGTMFWPPNIEGIGWFVDDVWPAIHAAAPQARLTLIGKNPPASIQILAQRPGVEVLGFVENLAPYLAEAAAFVVPLHAGGGMRVKIVDAWCWGLPVISTSIGAEGIAIRPGENLLIADEGQTFARAVLRVMGDPGLQASLRRSGRMWVEERYDWRRVYGMWDEVYGQLLEP